MAQCNVCEGNVSLAQGLKPDPSISEYIITFFTTFSKGHWSTKLRFCLNVNVFCSLRQLFVMQGSNLFLVNMSFCDTLVNLNWFSRAPYLDLTPWKGSMPLFFHISNSAVGAKDICKHMTKPHLSVLDRPIYSLSRPCLTVTQWR